MDPHFNANFSAIESFMSRFLYCTKTIYIKEFNFNMPKNMPFLFICLFDLCTRIWIEMSLNDSMTVYERSKLAVWDYPASDRYTKMWQSMKESGLPSTFEEAVERVRASPSSSEGYAFLGKI